MCPTTNETLMLRLAQIYEVSGVSVCTTLTRKSPSRMAAVSELSVLLFALISNIHAEELITIREESDSFTFKLPEEASSCLISRFVGEEKLVLWNTSNLWNQNSSVPEDLKQRLVSMANTSSYMIQNLTHSDSGLYQEECWTEGNVTHEKHFTITVCGYIADNLDVQWLKQDYRSEQENYGPEFLGTIRHQ
ncbi:hypothetical protein F7725_004009 [Dissostichus mawsoni]|uniref:Uncharacterized protein n=1 Tax=Dissostichus mawsoni TaxID=36200 RepID=A0A7J5YD47_DISMA|nr:hypothetical protein F7725_004009 [Dissostichus mawsoni]